ncbi:FkbM family methyltransferase [Vibrio fluvialis]|uniref:FkbM family methyltransferase n=1 Tax=Vibrio fluvialis TaxID=676 RepID=UPI0006E27D82|nr:FkbM family methyltransferase [Vibrio fluvialis]KQH84038.1 hypothetical protein AMR75_20505 [Vibrio fluvialis]
MKKHTFNDITGITNDITVLDLGAKCYSDAHQNYQCLTKKTVYGIDYFGKEAPDEKHAHFDCIFNVVIGDGSPKKLYITEVESCSSLFKPNKKLLENFQTLSEWMEVKDTIVVDTVKLNDIDLPRKPDFIKSDIQASDIYAIKHGSRYFDNALVIEIEVEFLQQYKNQPLFSEIEMILREKGYIFHTFTGYGSRFFTPTKNENDPYDTLNQWMWSHAIFIKDCITKELSEDEYLKIAQIAHDVYDSYDLALHCLVKSKRNIDNYHSFIKEFMLNETN